MNPYRPLLCAGLSVSNLLPRGAQSGHSMSSVTYAVTRALSLLCRRFLWGSFRLYVVGRPQAAASFSGREFRMLCCWFLLSLMLVCVSPVG